MSQTQAQDRVIEKLNKTYGKTGLDIQKLIDTDKIYTHHVHDGKLHGLFFNAMAMKTLKSAFVDYILPNSDEFSQFVKEEVGPMKYKGITNYLKKWLDELDLPKFKDMGCRCVTDEENDAQQHMVLIGCAFLPADQSYEIGWAIGRTFSMIDQVLVMLTQMLSLPTNPNEWEKSPDKHISDPVKGMVKHVYSLKSGLNLLFSVFPGYSMELKSKKEFLPKIFTENVDGPVLGSCNYEYAQSQDVKPCSSFGVTEKDKQKSKTLTVAQVDGPEPGENDEDENEERQEGGPRKHVFAAHGWCSSPF
jgi:hypothetical protein